MIDWLNPTSEDRMALHEAAKRFMTKHDLNVAQLLEVAFGNLHEFTPSDFGNLSKGTTGRKKVYKLYQWFEDNHPSEVVYLGTSSAEKVTGKIPFQRKREFTNPNLPNWKSFIQEHGAWNEIDVVRAYSAANPFVQERIEPSQKGNDPDTRYHVEPPDKNPISSTVLRLGEEFCFHLNSVHNGSVIGLQKWGPHWLELPLSGASAVCHLTDDQLSLPQGANGDANYLAQSQRAGRHYFAFLIADTELIENIAKDICGLELIMSLHLDPIAERLLSLEQNWKLLRLDVMFVA